MLRLSDDRVIAFAIFLFALAVRLATVAWQAGEPISQADQSEYLALAQNIRFHGVFSYGAPHLWGAPGLLGSTGPFLPTASRAPLYPFFIALLWWGQAPPILQVRIAQAFLGAGVALLVYLTARPLLGRRTAVIASLGMSVAPYSCQLVVPLVTETLFNFLLMLALWLWGGKRPFLAGLILGIANLARAILLPFIALLALTAMLFRFNRRAHAQAALAAVLVLAPWTIRNAVQLHAFIPVAATGWGANVFLGTIDVPFSAGNSFIVFGQDREFMTIIKTEPTAEAAEQKLMVAAMERIRSAPLYWFYVRLKQYPRLFTSSGNYLAPIIPLSRPALRIVYVLATVAFLILAGWGFFLTRQCWRSLYAVAALPAFQAAVLFVGLNEERYSTSMVPMLLIFAGYAVSRLLPGKP
ncbi:MAG TPA: hypothetical protein VMI56_28395 [Reyranella sp.]|nr:hypothetical protein [Reyranella sp.]